VDTKLSFFNEETFSFFSFPGLVHFSYTLPAAGAVGIKRKVMFFVLHSVSSILPPFLRAIILPVVEKHKDD
jgi:hypothetical protein